MYKEESRKNKGRKANKFALHEPVYVQVFSRDPHISQKLQPKYRGPLYITVFIGSSEVKLTTSPSGTPLNTIFHKDFIEPFVCHYVVMFRATFSGKY